MRYNESTQEVTMTVQQAWGLRGCVEHLMKRAEEGDMRAATTLAACGAAVMGAANIPRTQNTMDVFRVGVEMGGHFAALLDELSAVTREHAQREVKIVTDRTGEAE